MLWFVACAPTPVDTGSDDADALALRWFASYAAEDWSEARDGLAWTLTTIGATPPSDGSWILEQADGTLRLDLERAGLDPTQLAVDATSDLAVFGSVDLGRWLLATVYQPEVYYRVTGACATRAEWEARHPTTDTYFAEESAIAEGKRRIDLASDPASATDVQFRAGAIDETADRAREVETIDLLPSGQQRFAVYDAAGWLAPASSEPAVGPPGRCMWCHEGQMMTLIIVGAHQRGGITATQFVEQVEHAQAQLEATRATLDVDVDLSDSAAHEWAERLVQGFLSPTPERVSEEWGVELPEVSAWLAEAELHTDPEYGDLLERYDRDDVDAALIRRLAADGRAWTPLARASEARNHEAAPEDWDPAGFSCD